MVLVCFSPCTESLWIIVEVQDSMVMGLAEQLSGITTSDGGDFMDRTEAHLTPPLPCTPHPSPLQPCTPHPSPSSMHGELYQTDSELRTDSDQYFGNSWPWSLYCLFVSLCQILSVYIISVYDDLQCSYVNLRDFPLVFPQPLCGVLCT